MENNKLHPFIRIAMLFAILLGVILFAVRAYYWLKGGDDSGKVEVRTETIVRHDTILVKQPAPKAKTFVKYVSVPIFRTDTLMSEAMAVLETDTIYLAGDTLQLPITQRVYEDTNYIAYVSGINPALDSLKVVNREVERVVTITKYKPPNRIQFGIHAGWGYGFKSKTWEPHAGIGLTLRF